MIYPTKPFGLLIYWLLTLTLFGCQKKDMAETVKPALPSCDKSFALGYVDKSSYFPGDVVNVYVLSNSFRQCGLGLYDVNGSLIFSADVSIFPQKSTITEPWLNGFGYSIYSEIILPENLSSGIYFIERQIPVVVKSSTPTDVTVVYPINTINAYNSSGGKSLYRFNSTDFVASSIVSFLRPLLWDVEEEDRCMSCLKWFPSLGININYITDVDLNSYSSFSESKVLVIAGHSEYWTREARTNFDRFIRAGKNAVILSGNSMWWQVRYSEDQSQLTCYRDKVSDPDPDPAMKTILWADSSLNYPIIKSIGADFRHGGYGLKIDSGWNGYKIARPGSPLLEGLGLKRGDIISIPSAECDGAPISGFDADGFPILDNLYHFEKLELIGFDRGSRGGEETYPTFIVMKATASSGIVVNMATSDWCSSQGMGSLTSGIQLQKITRNAIKKLVDGSEVFSH